ncbi:MAG: metal ABC transporter permease [Verrucomicrobiae bacterium]|nr:metal ABC transporter permease [Verrucomicrobiae bacterium]NNJ86659.1 iron chelate uptake ABC transporter family permease subunit [Akkermansiaceae bacterium]
MLASIFDVLIPASGAGKALMAAVLLGAGCGLIGCFVVLRRVALMGDAVSHAVLPGVVAGLIYSPDRNPGFIFLCAAVAGLLGSGVMRAMLATTRLKTDTALGIILATFFAFGIMWQTRNQQDTVGVMNFLFGNVGSIDASDLRMMIMTTAMLVIAVFFLKRPLLVMSFDEGFSRGLGYPVQILNGVFYFLLTFSVVVALQAVGVVLVSAMLITPAAAAYLLTDRFGKMLVMSVTFGVVSGIVGALISAAVNGMPTGPVITLSATVVFAVVYFLAPQHGVMSKWVRRQRRRRIIMRENTLKAIYQILEGEGFVHEQVSIIMLARHRKQTEEVVRARCASLERHGLIAFSDDKVSLHLTNSGWKRAMELVRNHRLWELYLTNEADYADDHVHDDAEKIEHILGPHMVRQLEQDLDFPELDPHGKPIPKPNHLVAHPS